MNDGDCYLQQDFSDSGIPLVAIPTTAGTGSESTRFAVIYHQGVKQSVTHPSIIPNYAILEPAVLSSLPVYQKKCTVLDALCQGIESWWSINSTPQSHKLSCEAVRTLVDNIEPYIFEHSAAAAAPRSAAPPTAPSPHPLASYAAACVKKKTRCISK